MARCPAHDDKTPSLKIDDGDDGFAVTYCHAGCSDDEVWYAIKDLGLCTEKQAVNGRKPRKRAAAIAARVAPDGSEDRPYERRDSEALSMALFNLGYNVRLNLRSRRIEWREESEIAATDWTAINAPMLSDLREKIARQFFVRTKDGPKPLSWGRDTFMDALNALVFHRQVDPLVEWLHALPEWDGKLRLAGLLPMIFDVPFDHLTFWAGRYLVLGIIQRTLEPGCKLDEIPVLIGPQGIGKSALYRAILPPDMPGLFGDSLRWDATDKQMVEATLGCAIVEVSEMAGHRRAEIERIKAFVTRQDDGHVRLSYAVSTEPLPRRFILAATTNNQTDLPNDPSGNRRFVPIPATANKCGSVERFLDELRSQLWAEAMSFYRDGTRANLSRDLHAAQRDRAEQHRDRDDVLEDAIDRLTGDAPMTMAEIMDVLPESARGVSQHRLGKALRNAGWESKKTKTVRLWSRSPV